MMKGVSVDQAIDALIDATTNGRIRWQVNLPGLISAPVVAKLFGEQNSFTAEYAGMKLMLYDRRSKPTEQVVFRFGSQYELEEINLDIYEHGSNDPWHIPYQPKLDELMRAAKMNANRLPPDSVLERIISGKN